MEVIKNRKRGVRIGALLVLILGLVAILQTTASHAQGGVTVTIDIVTPVGCTCAGAQVDIYGKGTYNDGATLSVAPGSTLSHRARASGLAGDYQVYTVPEGGGTLTENRFSCVTLAVDAPSCASDAEVDVYGQGNSLEGQALCVPTGVSLSHRARASGRVGDWQAYPVTGDSTLTENRFSCVDLAVSTPGCWSGTGAAAEIDIYGQGDELAGDVLGVPTGISLSRRARASGRVGDWLAETVGAEQVTLTEDRFSCVTLAVNAPACCTDAEIDVYDQGNSLADEVLGVPTGINLSRRARASGRVGDWLSEGVSAEEVTLTEDRYCCMDIVLPGTTQIDIYGQGTFQNGDKLCLPTGIDISWRLKLPGLTCPWQTKHVDCTPLAVEPKATVDLPQELIDAGATVSIRYGASGLGDGAQFDYTPGQNIQWKLTVNGFSSAWKSTSLGCDLTLHVTDADYCHMEIQIPDDLAAAGAQVNIRYDSPDMDYGDDTWVYLPKGLTIQWQLKVSGFTSGYYSHEVDCNPLVVTDAHYCHMQIQIPDDLAAAGAQVNIRYSSLGWLGDGAQVYLPTGITIQWQLKVSGSTSEYYSHEVDCSPLVVPDENQPPVADANGPYLVAIGQSVDLDGSASSDPDGDPLTESWAETGDEALGTIDDSIFTAGPIAGITEVTLTVDDGRGGTATDTAMLVVYDPSGGFVTGGGWIDSQPGAYKLDPNLSGKATFGFISKYKKGASVPTGNTEFQFKAGDLNFHSSDYDWLVVTGSNYAHFKGTGTINGAGEFKFMIWAGDRSPDTFRIKIWDEDGQGETVVYDNGMDQAIGGGSIVVHNK